MSLLGAMLALLAQEPLSDSMTLPGIEAAIQAHPPSTEHWAARRQIALSLDRHVRVHVRDGMTDDDRAALRPLRDFYRRRVDEGLDRLERCRVTGGVHIFKFYSSSYILKSAEGTVAVDFAQGPISNAGEPEACDRRRTEFHWTPVQRDRLARLVDVSLITHRHHDHSDYSLSKRLLARGGTVVAPAQFKGLWKDLADRLTVPDYGREQKIGPVAFAAMLGSQYSTNRPDEKGVRSGYPNRENPAADSETILYLFRIGGLTFIQAGENHVPSGDWLNARAATGWTPDVRMSVGQFQGARSAEAFLKTKPPCYVLPIHEYEMTHAGGGNRMGVRFKDADMGRSMPLFWGEDFLLTRAIVERNRK